jgi:eukaryotic-like serine/threonine-protein kinase
VIGKEIGNYRIRELLGEGGMGRVYLAVHPGIERSAAVKVLHPHLASDAGLLGRFIAEARAASAIRHPGIVDIYDCGTLAGGTPYIVMELLEGRTLRAELNERRPSLWEAIDWTCQMADALSAAHAKQIVHRDLKPENVFLVPDPRRRDRWLIKILDFGIAKLQKSFGPAAYKTRTGSLMGTPTYMSPEQCLGNKEVDARSDIYALAVIAYEMFCGAPPFVSDGVGALIHMHINEMPAPLRTQNQEVSEALEAVILRALSKSPDHRQSSMDLLLDEIAAAVGSDPAHALLTPAPVAFGARVSRGASPARSSATPAAADKTFVLPPTATAAGSARPEPTVPPVEHLQTQPGRGRRWLIPAVAAAVGVAGVMSLQRGQKDVGDLGAERSAPSAAVNASIRAAVPEPESTAPKQLEIPIDSDPPGATVTVDGVVVGNTPTTYSTNPGHVPIAFELTLKGHRPQVIKALPSPGVRVNAMLEREAPPRVRPTARRRALAPASVDPTPEPTPALGDIKFSR